MLNLHCSIAILVSIVVSIPACHAGDRGSIPRRGEFFNLLFINVKFFYQTQVATLQSKLHICKEQKALNGRVLK